MSRHVVTFTIDPTDRGCQPCLFRCIKDGDQVDVRKWAEERKETVRDHVYEAWDEKPHYELTEIDITLTEMSEWIAQMQEHADDLDKDIDMRNTDAYGRKR